MERARRAQRKWAVQAAAGCLAFGTVLGGFVSAWGAGELPAPAPLTSPAGAGATFVGRAVIPYKTLTWDDFRVDDDAQGMAAETGTALSFRYASKVEKTPKDAPCPEDQTAPFPFTARVSRITFSGGFDRVHSWRRSAATQHPDAPRLLAHEQGHLDIAEAGRRRLETLPLSDYPEGHGLTASDAASDLKARMTLWFRAESARINIRQLQYDMETEFSTKKTAQAQWSERLTGELQAPDAANTAPVVIVSAPVPSSETEPAGTLATGPAL